MAKTSGRSKTVAHQGRTTTAEKADLGWTHRVKVEDVDHFLDARALSALNDAQLQKASDGMCSLRTSLTPQQGEVSLLTVAALLWLSELQHGDKPDFRQIAGGLKVGMRVEVELNDPDEDDDPEG